MFSRIWLINVLMALFVAFFGFRAYGVWFQDQQDTLAEETAPQSFQAVENPEKLLGKRQVPPENNYAALITQNLFSPNRKEDVPKVEKVEQKKKALTSAEQKKLDDLLDKIILYGLVITDDSATALVSDVEIKMVRRKGRIIRHSAKVKAAKWIEAGDKLGHFEVSEIKPDRVVLTSGDKTYNLLLYDKNKLKAHAPPNQKKGPVVVGSAAAKSGSPEKKGTESTPVPNSKPTASPPPKFPKKPQFPKKPLNNQSR